MRGLILSCLIAVGPGLVGPGLVGPALAGDPTCPVSEICRRSNDNCAPHDGLVVLRVIAAEPVLKVAISLDGGAPVEAVAVRDPKHTTLMATQDGTEHQFRLQPDGSFTYLVTTPHPGAPRDADQRLYRGTCVEG
ncbi:MAG: hypothetical protein CSA74_08200 [Rhodobacterales bacterium]|nr:MAG: hypothetical protein CSA74_08200 [Rhodobacterales bacterium]